jgi:hypothetical protein
LDGRLLLEVPSDFSEGNPRKANPNYVELTSLQPADKRFSVLVTYGKHIVKTPNFERFLDDKIKSYARLKKKYHHFDWLKHAMIKRDGRDWAEVSFAHDLSRPYGPEAYTRCISTLLDGRLP